MSDRFDKDKFIVWFNEVDKDDIALVGGKGANLGEMASFGIPVPAGFIVTSKAYFYFLKENKLEKKIELAIKSLDESDPQSYAEVSSKIKRLIADSIMPKDLALEIMRAYLKLGGIFRQVYVAVRSSATAEDLPTASFAGQQATFLNVKGEANVVEKVKECFASLFEARAIFYREEKGFDHFKVGIAVPIQKMVQSKVSGVMFTTDPVGPKKNIILIEAIYGLGELIVQGTVTPDRYEVDKKTLKILDKQISSQPLQLIKVGEKNVQKLVQSIKQSRQKITDKQIIELARLGKRIHQHYFFPQDIEWAVEGRTIYLLQTRPVTTLKEKPFIKEKWEVSRGAGSRFAGGSGKWEVILRGTSASPGIGTGKVCVIHSAKELKKVEKGDVLVTEMTSPDFVPVMKKVVAIVTDRGGQTSHAAIVSRELGIPCIVGTFKATQVLKNDQVVTVNGSKGEIYKGGIQKVPSSKFQVPNKFQILNTKYPRPTKTATKIYVNLAEPELTAKVARENVDGVGLLRAEFMIAEIGQHPRRIIKERGQRLFVEKLVENLSIFCQHFSPRPVVYRATDFKTNEYQSLVGGKEFEQEEANPFLGFRGAARYIADEDVFEMELEAIKKVRNKLGFRNLWLMIPFVRTPQELQEVKKIIVSSGLIRSPSFKLWMMVEIPSNVILLEDFIKVGIDGVSIGSNDLTMLLLGVDRDNEKLAKVFNEEDEAVLWALKRVIKTCHQYKITSSICGQAPSTKPSLIKKLVEWGITSISVNPDVIEKTRRIIWEAERGLISK